MSPSFRRVWVEISRQRSGTDTARGHPPCGGCGLKYLLVKVSCDLGVSPSLRRVWVEMVISGSIFPNTKTIKG